MCGIAGTLGVDACHDAAAAAMSAALYHRGPDDSGVWSDSEVGIALGHRRLSILELSPAGHQPMLSAEGRYVLVFNGEIYNHLELRARMEGECTAPAWHGHSDTETLLACFSAWGVEPTLKAAVGMFALALWDRRERVLHLARDRMGEKPLYYGWVGSAFVFASELKALQAFPGFTGTVDRDALALYLRYNYVPAPYSIYSGIYKLEPGCRLRVGPDAAAPSGVPITPMEGKRFELRRWWSLGEVAASGQRELFSDADGALEYVEGRLSDAIGLQSIADVPLGAFLSGGIDSSLVVALMQARATRPVRTFTIGFHESGFDEAVHAREVARHLGTDHTELYVTPEEARAVIPQLPTLYDEPFADSSQIPTFLVSRMARGKVTVALSGDGGDELFGGYNRYFWGNRIWRKVGWLPYPLRRGLARALLARSPDQWDRLAGGAARLGVSVSQLGDKLHKLAGCLGSADLDDLYLSLVSVWPDAACMVRGTCAPETLLDRRGDWPALTEPEHRMMVLDALTYLPDDILCKVDRAAMGVSLETRVPFLDHRVVEAAWRLPLALKIRDGQGKWVLRQILYKYVPRELIERPKQGFGIPLGDWLRGPLREWAESLLDEARLEREGYLDPKPIRETWRQHLDGRTNGAPRLWGVLMFQAWLNEQPNPKKT